MNSMITGKEKLNLNKMKNHYREPIEHTCPQIDKYIKNIKFAIEQDRYLRVMNEKELYEAASIMANELEACIDYLEELRSSNDTLRQWGIDEAEEVDRLQAQLDEMETITDRRNAGILSI